MGAMLILSLLFFYFFGRFLVVNETPRKSDAIILLSGGAGRLEKGVELLNEGYAGRMIVTKTDGRGPGEIRMRAILRAGVPADSVIPDYDATSTYTNAVNSRRIMERNGFASALVVSSTYHMRRVQYIFDKVYRGSGIRLTYVAAPSPNFDPARWWSRKIYVKYALTEYAKWIGYMIKY
ncbi:YdcF family protein [Cohnella caldifontis]|uniref:YdcF family protein n=1 Tax=Cohnella caldifontis TaxID=3027471 RepID=UPI0023EA830D|nr:YdcF family protein [Cohnella sp. YIM B05605]